MLKNKLYYFFCGIAMGAADVIPGVSGGTIAFISGIYEKLLDAIQSVDKYFFKALLHLEIRKAFAHIPWDFLLPLVLGIATSIFSLASVVLFLLENEPELIWSFFFGLILASAFILSKSFVESSTKMGKKIGKKIGRDVLLLLLGAVFAFMITKLPSIQMGHSALAIFISGFIAICAMILPGISGSFLLVLMGQYEYILTAISSFDILVLLIFIAGAACGIMIFARILKVCLSRFYSSTLAILIGIMLGSLHVIWPFRIDGVMLIPTDWNFDLFLSLVLFVLGLVIPLCLVKISASLTIKVPVKVPEKMPEKMPEKISVKMPEETSGETSASPGEKKI